jgi:hypothetical protein
MSNRMSRCLRVQRLLRKARFGMQRHTACHSLALHLYAWRVLEGEAVPSRGIKKEPYFRPRTPGDATGAARAKPERNRRGRSSACRMSRCLRVQRLLRKARVGMQRHTARHSLALHFVHMAGFGGRGCAEPWNRERAIFSTTNTWRCNRRGTRQAGMQTARAFTNVRHRPLPGIAAPTAMRPGPRCGNYPSPVEVIPYPDNTVSPVQSRPICAICPTSRQTLAV